MKLRIGILCPYDYFRHGGVQEHVRAVADELRARGHYVKVIAPTTVTGSQANDPNVILIGASKKIDTPFATSAELAVSANPKDIDAMFAQENFDIIHAHEPILPLLSRQILAHSVNTKNIATFHARLPDSFVNKSLEKAWYPYVKSVLKHIDTITAVSDAAAMLIKTVTEKPITIIPNGIQSKKFEYSKVKRYSAYDDNVPTILYVGRLEKRKGVEYLLKAYRKVVETHPEVRLIVVGDGPKRKVLESQVEKYKLENVDFLGFVSEEDKYSLMKTATVYCSPALYGESFGIVLLEAMLMRVAIVAGNNPGYESVMKERGKLGIVDPTNVTDFAKRLEMFLFDSQLRTLFSKWSSEYVKQFDYGLVTDKYELLYKELMK